MFVTKEEHDGDRIVELVHLFEVGNLIEIADVDDGEVFDSVGDAVEDFILSHTFGVPITTETDDDKALFF